MKSRIPKFAMAAVLLVVFAACSFAQADVFMKEKYHMDGMNMMGHAQPPVDRINTIWLTKDKMRSDQGDTSTIIHFSDEKFTMYMLMHPDKTYMEFPMGAGAMQGAGQQMGNMKLTITPTDETKKIGKWNCRKYIQKMDMGMMPMTSEVWATEDIKMPYYETYEKLGAAMWASQPGMKASMEAMQKEAKKIKGVRVLTLTTMTMMKDTQVKSSQELLEIKEGTAPAGIFDIPGDYVMQEMPQGMGGGGGMRGRQRTQ